MKPAPYLAHKSGFSVPVTRVRDHCDPISVIQALWRNRLLYTLNRITNADFKVRSGRHFPSLHNLPDL